jgi:hypothetical protein
LEIVVGIPPVWLAARMGAENGFFPHIDFVRPDFVLGTKKQATKKAILPP